MTHPFPSLSAAWTRRRLMAAAGLLAAPALHAQPAGGSGFPGKPVRIITPFPVGGGPDGTARVLADRLSRTWNQPVLVDNRPGGNGFIAIEAFKRGAKDGTDIIQLDNVHLAAYPALFKKLPYDVNADFDPLVPLFRTYFFITVAANSPYKTAGDLIADARARPGQLNYGSWSIGNPVHLGSELLAAQTGTQMQHVVYKETTQLYTAVANGELSFALGTSGTAGPLFRAGKVRLLAVAAPRRVAGFESVPTVAESGGPANFVVSGGNVLAVPRGLPSSVTGTLRRDIAQALDTPAVHEKYASFGYESFPQTPQQFAAFLQDEQKRFGDVIRNARIAVD
ncbi:Bug family tripartite tricarboxylate transporter substrate binding protein [Xylophilus sp.]|uniref:Bug family tripartite tricarboxylate transporter substrate binding protein n=1 Tax=Xylophilus sp. TaxID=2653893 RepID=UPI0013B65F45|nr:tripartite tricarboxylate transporter substrate binding protein [Xylophilus sp.]KAF1050243.1 MAG: hypothetical protein GAK38_00269 [Xylophilus sp.]